MSNIALQSLPQNPDPNVPQRLAASPDMDAWVEASAGSGKTKVLTDRVLRLLLPDVEGRWQGAKPHKILCITFTKAAAALMSLRVQERLAKWAVMPEADVREDLYKNLLGFAPSDAMVTVARRLFSEVLDVPGGLAIMTIHSFCQSVLSRFPLESGIAPGFRVLDETQSSTLMADIIRKTVIGIRDNNSTDTSFAESFQRLAVYKDINAVQDILQKLMAESWQISQFLGDAADTRAISHRLLAELGEPIDLNSKYIWDNTISRFSDDDMLQLTRFMADATKTEQKAAQKVADYLAINVTHRQENLSLLKEALFTTKDAPRAFKTFDTGPEHLRVLMKQLLSTVMQYEEKIGLLQQVEQTADLLTIAGHCLTAYAQHKKQMGALDFTDMIVRTRRLLESQSLDWVHFKLDEGIDHILVDEAQDTNNNQWEIIRLLSDEFHAGEGRNQDCPRSFFVVGDKKQSIFSFHGADPTAFEKMHDLFATRARQGGRVFLDDRVRLETSFRTVLPILQFVDTVFEPPDMAAHLGLGASQNLVHYSDRKGDAGFVQLWPLLEREKPAQGKSDLSGHMEWELPPVSTDTPLESGGIRMDAAGDSPLARQIALKIAALIETEEKLPASNRRIEPRDILILVRTRTGFVGDMVRQLKLYGIPVSGVDRLVLGDHIAVADCLALARFAKLPDDDLSLACVLKSPFIRLGEDDLMNLALARGSKTLWNHICDEAECGHISTTIVTWLADVIAAAKLKKPFEFYDDLLNGPCPHDPDGSGWRAMSQELGEDCRDPLAEFLGIALKLEQEGVYGLQEFIDRFEKQTIQIKRDIAEGSEDSPNEVRIMTVHASKGLEAPIVFLPDTTGFPDRRKLDSLQWILPQGSKNPIPLWSAGASGGAMADIYKQAKESQFERNIAEYHRLFYVALTRARDRLYITGEKKAGTELKPHSWYALAATAFAKLGIMPDDKTGSITLSTPQTAIPKKVKINSGVTKEKVMFPAWLREKPSALDITKTRIINPSRMQQHGDVGRVVAPYEQIEGKTGGGKSEDRFLRGNLTHKLFQILPNIPDVSAIHRRQVAAQFLERAGRGLSVATRTDIVDEVMRILTDPVFADVFGPRSLAEVAVTGPIGDGQVINGQIDRLVVLPDRILIVDFKTNRPSPDDIADIPIAYRQQLAAYKAAISRIYPRHTVLCALLWTDKPYFMPVDIE